MKQQTKNIIRWILLLPTLCITWFVSVMLCAWLESLFYSPDFLDSYGKTLLYLDLFIIPSIAMFFVAKYLSPKYKTMMGCFSVVLCALWCQIFVNALAYSY